jgi:hypothetical protein
MADVAVSLTGMGQPALLYLVPCTLGVVRDRLCFFHARAHAHVQTHTHRQSHPSYRIVRCNQPLEPPALSTWCECECDPCMHRVSIDPRASCLAFIVHDLY